MFDIHAHLNFQAFNDDYAEVIKNSQANGVTKIINIGSNWLTSQKAVQIAKEFDVAVQRDRETTLRCFAAVGLHPIHVKDEEFDIKKYCSQVLKNIRTIKAIGETGLDFYRSPGNQGDNHEQQKQVFLKHLELAKEVDLPVILHCRGDKNAPHQAYEDLLSTLQATGHKLQGEVHCFSADWNVAQKFLDLGFYIGFTGIITYPNAGEELLEVVARMPLDRILVETDCPYLAPQPVRGQRCEPWHMKYTLEKIAELRKMSLTEIEKITEQNSQKLFSL